MAKRTEPARDPAEAIVEELLAILFHRAYVPAAAPIIRSRLADLVADLLAALAGHGAPDRVGDRAGALMVELNVTDPQAVAGVIEVLSDLPERLFETPDAAVMRRMVSFTGAFGIGYSVALHRRTIEGQAALYRAMAAARHSADETARAVNLQFRTVFDHAGVGIAITDTDGLLRDANPTLARMLGRSVAELRGTSGFGIVHHDDEPAAQAVFRQLADTPGATREIELRYRRGDGDYGHAQWTVTAVPTAGEHDGYVIGIGQDITALRHLQDQLDHIAHHDPLTNLPNRRRLESALVDLTSRIRSDDSVGFCLIDIDDFKTVNDQFGHAAGDQLLVEIGARLTSHTARCETRCLVARIGGDEFAVLIDAPADESCLAVVAGTLIASLATPITLEQRRIQVSTSVGTALAPAAASVADLLNIADSGLHRAKATGKRQWQRGHGRERSAGTA